MMIQIHQIFVQNSSRLILFNILYNLYSKKYFIFKCLEKFKKKLQLLKWEDVFFFKTNDKIQEICFKYNLTHI